MDFWAVVPSRFGSTRFPGKPLALIAGIPLLQRVVEQIRKAKGLKRILVATDNGEIEALCKKIQAEVVMTDSALESGTDRIYQAVLRSGELPKDEDVVINIQGDEPLIPPPWIERMISTFKNKSEIQILTMAHPISAEELGNRNSVKVVLRGDEALLFTRSKPKDLLPEMKDPMVLKHIGIYGYRWKTLVKFCKAPPSQSEKAEKLEQLRAMDMGISIHVLKVEGAIQGVDVPEDVNKVEKLLSKYN